MEKVLIANRGEIALRVIRACKEMGIGTVAVYSEADRWSHYLTEADEAYLIGGPAPHESYLRIPAIVEVAKKTKCSAIHPGYGFLSENPDFAAACEKVGILFIGPSSDAIRRLGNKVNAGALAKECGVPTLPRLVTTDPSAKAIAGKIGFPALIKAAAGGGGRGMRVVRKAGDLERAIREAQSEAKLAFGDPTIFVERYIAKARHVEIQILADGKGNVVHLGERECSIQRRHQKLIEESPSTAVTSDLRERMGNAAVALAKAAGYRGAGTVEFILDEKGEFAFLEVNTRLQVEHPVTEMVTGIDIVRQQLLIAMGEKLALRQEGIAHRGSAIECRICAEDPFNNFTPSTGEITALRLPAGPFTRVDTDMVPRSEVTRYYDSLIAKLIVWGEDRQRAIDRMARALDEIIVVGVQTTTPFHRAMMRNRRFRAGEIHTQFLGEEKTDLRLPAGRAIEAAAIAVILEAGRKASMTPVYRGGRSLSAWKKAVVPEQMK